MGKVTPPVWLTLLVLHRSEPAARASVSMWWAATHSDVRDGGPARGQSPPSHHVLVVAAVIRRVGVPAVLEVVAQHVVPVVLLL